MKWWVPGPGRWESEELVFNEHRISVWKDEEVLGMDGGGGSPAL